MNERNIIIKQITCFLFAVVIAISSIGCGATQNSTDYASETEPIETITSILPVEDDVSNESGKEQETASPYKLTSSMMVSEELDGMVIKQTDTVNGITYSLTLDLSNATGYTSQEQLIMCTKLFWYSYPKMYEAMAVADTPVDVNLLVEDSGYEIAEQWENNVHIHDRWLYEHEEDYDCLTHEFAHVIQTNWEGLYSPQYEGDAYLIERFADACRYMYAYEGGIYNDKTWTLNTPDTENHYSNSNRFWVWIEKNYSTDGIDIFRRLVEQTQIKDEAHEYTNWENGGSMWDEIFKGTSAEGKTLEELWEEFLQTDFAWGK